jgi:hypothetical protein
MVCVCVCVCAKSTTMHEAMHSHSNTSLHFLSIPLALCHIHTACEIHTSPSEYIQRALAVMIQCKAVRVLRRKFIQKREIVSSVQLTPLDTR